MPSFKPTINRRPNLRELPVASFLDRFTTTQTALDLLFKTDSSFTATVNQMVEDGDPVPDLIDEMALTQRWFLDLADAVGASRDRLVEGVEDALRGAAAAGGKVGASSPAAAEVASALAGADTSTR